MIILDDDEGQLPKLANPAPVYSPPVNRSTTPTSSLPDYEEFEYDYLKPKQPEAKWKRPRFTARCWRITLITLLLYCILTTAIGVPLVLRFARQRDPDASSYYSPPPSWNAQEAVSLISAAQSAVSSEPPFITARDCDLWNSTDVMNKSTNMYMSKLQISVPFNYTGVFVGSNGTFRAGDPTHGTIIGSLFVGVNNDPSVDTLEFDLTMTHSEEDIRSKTHICVADVDYNTGVYIYVPDSLDRDDTLNFNATFLLPQNKSALLSEFATMLPMFSQQFGDLASQFEFDSVVIGGPMSPVNVESIKSSSIAVMSSPAEIRGSFEVYDSIVLETMSAPINVDIQLTSSARRLLVSPSSSVARLNTGNSPLNANITVGVKPSSSGDNTKLTNSQLAQQLWTINANTFNAPLNMSIQQIGSTATRPLAVVVQAGNNLGDTHITADQYFQGDFQVQTMYASAVVRDEGVDSDSTFAVRTPSSSVDSVGRTVAFDEISDGTVTGWLGVGPRSMQSPACLSVMSVLNPVFVDFG